VLAGYFTTVSTLPLCALAASKDTELMKRKAETKLAREQEADGATPQEADDDQGARLHCMNSTMVCIMEGGE
jgi:hypothetical protein